MTPAQPKRIVVCHHSADFDGIASREVCLHQLRRRGETNITAIGWDYGDPVPEHLKDPDSFDELYMVDISIDTVLAQPWFKEKGVLIDHHRTCINKWGSSGLQGILLEGVAACRLAWQYFDPTPGVDPANQTAYQVDAVIHEPRVLRLLGEWDVFDLHDPDTIPLQLGMKAMSDEKVAHFLQCELREHHGEECFGDVPMLHDVIYDGVTIQRYEESENFRHAIQHAYTIQWEGLCFCVLNTGRPGNSRLFAGAYRDHHDALLAWRWDGKQFYVSLYHRPGREDIDLSVIAQQYFGGGHPGACGFRCKAKVAIGIGIIA